MAKIPEQKIDITLREVDKKYYELYLKQEAEKNREYLGMSEIGDDCWRKLFFSFRSAAQVEFESEEDFQKELHRARADEDGNDQEIKMAERLRLLPFIELHTVEPGTDEQIAFSLLLGHFNGHADGMIKGIKEAPQTWHTWENKAVNEKKFEQLINLKQEKGEKEALKHWDICYYGQAIIYMHCSQAIRHFLTVETPGGRKYISCRTEYNKKYAEELIEKAKIIIFDNWSLPARLSENREFWKCKWCDYQKVCHDGRFPLVNCKTCRYSEPVNGGIRHCHKHEKTITDDFLMKGCSYHIYNPALISAKLIEHQEDGCLYETESGYKFANVYATGIPELKGDLDGGFPSEHLFSKIKYVNNLSREAVKVQQAFQGEFMEPEKVPVRKAWDTKKSVI